VAAVEVLAVGAGTVRGVDAETFLKSRRAPLPPEQPPAVQPLAAVDAERVVAEARRLRRPSSK
jgi:hypothetical protein